MTTRFSYRERDARWHACRCAMIEQGLDALLICANDTRGEKGGLRYVAEYRPFHRFGYCLLPREGAATLILHPVLAHAARSPWIDRHLFTGIPGDAIVALCKERGWTRIGTINADQALRVPDWKALRASGMELVDASDGFEAARAIKSEAEIASLERSAEIADRCFRRLIEIARPGTTDATLDAALTAVALAAGAEETLFLTMRAVRGDDRGSHARLARPASGEIVAAQAYIFSIELAGPGGHWVELARPLLFPGASPEARDTVETAFKALAAARDVARPGVGASDIQRAIVSACDPDLFVVENASGHAIGQDIIETPRIALLDLAQPPFRAGMALTIHPMATRRDVPAIGYCADTYTMEADGLRALSGLAAIPWEMPA